MNQRLTSLRLLALLALLAGTSQSAVEAQNFGRLSLTIVDNNGDPIEGALIVTTCPELESLHIETTSNAKGKAIIAFADATKYYNLLFEKEGFTPVTISVKPEVRKTMTREVSLPPRVASDSQEGAEGTAGSVVRFTPAEEAFNRGVTAIRANDLSVGKIGIMEALELDPSMASGYAALAAIYLEEKNYQAALKSAQDLQTLEPDNPQIHRILYDVHSGLGNKEEADAALRALSLVGDGQDAAVMVYNEGVAALKIGSIENAKTRFVDALALQPTMVPALSALIAIYMDEESYPEAIASTERLLVLEPNNAKALWVRYQAFRANGDTVGEKLAFDQLVAVDPSKVGLQFYDKGTRLFNAGDLVGGAAQFEKALMADPSLAKAHYHLGLCHVNQGKNTLALEHLQKFVEMAPDDADVPVAQDMLKYLGE